MKKMILLLSCLFAIIGMTNAQVSKVSGLVIAKEDGLPVIGASVVVDGDESISAVTDYDGKFILTNVPSSAKTLIVSFIGMKTVKVSIAPEVEVQLKKQSKALEYGKNSLIVGINYFYPFNATLKGYTLGYSHMFNLSKNGKFFLETGAFFQYFQSRDNELSHYYDDDNNMITINFKAYRYARAYIPVNVGYIFNLGNSGISITPKFGVNIIKNIYGRTNLHSENLTYGVEYLEWSCISDSALESIYAASLWGAEIAYKKIALGIQLEKAWKTIEIQEGEEVEMDGITLTLAYRF